MYIVGKILDGVPFPESKKNRPNQNKYGLHELKIGQCRTISNCEVARVKATLSGWASSHGWTIVMQEKAIEKRGEKEYGDVTVWRDKDRTTKTSRQRKMKNGGEDQIGTTPTLKEYTL